jgi:N-acetylglucosamine kinase-like BadF-type ATPase
VTRPSLLAVDAGNSKVDAALVTKAGAVVGAARLRGSLHDGSGTESHLHYVSDAVRAACSAGGIDPERPPVAHLGVYCLAGADFPADDERIARWVRQRGWTSEDVIRNDAFAVLRAGTERGWGVAVVCGYGTNCAGLAPDGRAFRLPAVGVISGDWGGGMDIGETALWHANRAEDGRGDPTTLAELVPAYFGMSRPRQVTEALHFQELSRERIGELPPLVFRAARDGDAVARQIVRRQADEIVTMAGTAIRELRMTELDVEVVLGGGIFRCGNSEFFARIRAGLQSVATGSLVKELRAPPLVGAALIGLDRQGASTAAGKRARATLTHEHLDATLDLRLEGGGPSWRRSSSRA